MSDGTGKPGNPNWYKGMPSSNPGGRTSGKFTRKFLSEEIVATDGKSTATRRELVHLALFKIGIKPEGQHQRANQLRALELLKAYDEGRPSQSVEVSDNRPGSLMDLTFLGVDNLERMNDMSEAAAREEDKEPSN